MRATASSPCWTRAARSSSGDVVAVARVSASSASSRITVSIVPSTGLRTARYASSLPERSARAILGASNGPGRPSSSAAPRTIWERITPEFPRALISAARVASWASAARSSAVEVSSASSIPWTVSARFVPVSPSGTG